LAEALGVRAVLSLAGVTRQPLTGGASRSGGFGGAEGLRYYLEDNHIDALVDATHPFAANISRNAVQAAAAAGLPLLRLVRPAWPSEQSWLSVADLAKAAASLPTGARVFLSVGSRSLQPFLTRADVWFLSRCIEPPPKRPAWGEVLLQKPPFNVKAEQSLFEQHRITHIVSKNAGGGGTQAKLVAARTLGVQVVMVSRPKNPAALEVASVEEALTWIANQKGKP